MGGNGVAQALGMLFRSTFSAVLNALKPLAVSGLAWNFSLPTAVQAISQLK